jgi:hypothetical protein
MNNVQNCDSYINIPSSQTWEGYLLSLPERTKCQKVGKYYLLWSVLMSILLISFLGGWMQLQPHVWSSGQSTWLQIQRSRVLFPALPDFLKSSVSGTGSTQPREYNWGATWYKSSGSCLETREYGRRDPSRWSRGTLYPQNFAITSLTSGGRSVGIVRSRTQAMEISLALFLVNFVSAL